MVNNIEEENDANELKATLGDLIRLCRSRRNWKETNLGDQGDMGRDTGDGIRIRNIAYQPLPSQLRFHNSKARFKGFSGPMGQAKASALPGGSEAELP
jgi:hypothetical protein